MIEISSKQAEYIRNANKRYNCKMGATQSGKTHLDGLYVIPSRLLERKGKEGINVIVGVSRETIERNVLSKIRRIHGNSVVSEINNRNVATILGEKVYCLGAKDKGQVSVFRGLTAKYIYIDEFPDISEDVFNIFPSRMSLPYSVADITGNPKSPAHWSEKWLAKVQNIYFQRYTIFDNPFLDVNTRQSIITDYEGTIFYDRYVLGLPKRAEGAIYRKFADNPGAYQCEVVDKANADSAVKQFLKSDITSIEIGLDFGGSTSGHALVARGYTDSYKEVVMLMSRRVMAKDETECIDSNKLDKIVLAFIKDLLQEYGYKSRDYYNVEGLYYDNAETVLGHSIRNAVEKVYPFIAVRPAKKARINDRINCVIRLMGANRFYYTKDCETLKNALIEAVYDAKKTDKDERLDDGTSDIDTLDAMEYSIERDIKYLIQEVE